MNYILSPFLLALKITPDETLGSTGQYIYPDRLVV